MVLCHGNPHIPDPVCEGVVVGRDDNEAVRRFQPLEKAGDPLLSNKSSLFINKIKAFLSC